MICLSFSLDSAPFQQKNSLTRVSILHAKIARREGIFRARGAGFFAGFSADPGGFFFPVAGVFPRGGRQIQQLKGRLFRSVFASDSGLFPGREWSFQGFSSPRMATGGGSRTRREPRPEGVHP
jgi:hypothetical protein